MSTPRKVAVLVGSLRKQSINRKAAHALMALAPEGLSLEIVEIGDLALFNQDDEATPSPAYTRFRQEVKAADAVLFVTPEYNRTIPGALKNAIDVGSRPYGQSVWAGKSAAVVTCAPGALGGFGSNHNVRQAMVFLNVPVMQMPEAYIGGADKLFDDAGNLTNDSTKKFLATFLEAFAKWVEIHAPAKTPA